jgi:hypothetical protein
MTSTVTNFSSLINTTYPIPGVDNDTQGFRDNFRNIQQALSAAANEITKLQFESQYRSSEPASSAGTAGDRKGMIFATTNTLYVCFQNHTVGITDPIWVKFTGGTTNW